MSIVYLNDRPLTELVRDVLTLEGHLAPAVAQRSTLPSANAAGMFGSSVTLPSRPLTVALDVRPPRIMDRASVLDAIIFAVGGLRLYRTADVPDRELWVHFAGANVVFYAGALAHAEFRLELTFTAVDPTRYERESVPIALSTARATLDIGTATSAPLLYLFGGSPSVVDPVAILRSHTGDEVGRLTLSVTLATDDALVIDSARQSIKRYVAGVLQTGTSSGDACLVSGSFPVLAPEDARDGDGITLELSAASGTPTGLALYTRGF